MRVYIYIGTVPYKCFLYTFYVFEKLGLEMKIILRLIEHRNSYQSWLILGRIINACHYSCKSFGDISSPALHIWILIILPLYITNQALSKFAGDISPQVHSQIESV